MKRIFMLISVVWIGLIAQACNERGGMSPTNLSDEAVVLRFMELMDSHQFDQLEEVLGESVEFHLGNNTLNRDDTIAMIKSFYEAFPDFTHSPEEIYSVDGRVIMRATDRATHIGDFQGIPGSGSRIEVGQIAIYRVEDGRIVEVQEQFDSAGLMEQIQARGPTQSGDADVSAGYANQIMDTYRKRVDSIESGDFELWLSVHSDDVRFIDPDQPDIVGKESLKEWGRPLFESVTMNLNETMVEMVARGNLAYIHYQWDGALVQQSDGQSVPWSGKGMLIVQPADDGTWKVTHNIWNFPAPATE